MSHIQPFGNLKVKLPQLGLGCMGMSEFYGPANDDESLKVLDRAYELGVRLFDTADMYGNGHNEQLLSRFLAKGRTDAFIATKFGIRRKGENVYERTIDNSPQYIREACEASLKRLGRDVIDLYIVHRINPAASIEETVATMADLVAEGKIRQIGLSEVSANTLRKAHAVHPIAAIQTEYSLWTRDIEPEILPTCRELSVSIMAYSPLGRGFLTGQITNRDGLSENDFRLKNPRFSQENLHQNNKLLETLKDVAAAHKATPAQIALAWVLAQGPDVFPIPGTKRIKYLEDNISAAQVELTKIQIATLGDAFPVGAAAGERYPEAGQVGLNA